MAVEEGVTSQLPPAGKLRCGEAEVGVGEVGVGEATAGAAGGERRDAVAAVDGEDGPRTRGTVGCAATAAVVSPVTRQCGPGVTAAQSPGGEGGPSRLERSTSPLALLPAQNL